MRTQKFNSRHWEIFTGKERKSKKVFQELGTVMMQLGEYPTEQELKTMVAEVDQVES